LHKKRIKDRDYFYTTIRKDPNKTKTIYLGSNKRKAIEKERELGLTHKESPHFIGVFLVLLAILSLGAVGFSFTGFVVEDVTISEESLEGLEIDNSQESDIEIGKETEETTEEEIPEEEPEIEVNETEVVEEEPEIELNQTTEINETIEIPEEEPEIELNETIELNQTTEINETIEIPEEEPEIELNETVELNETEIILNTTNQTIINQSIELNKNITELYYEVIINQPVKWEKSVELEKEVISLEIKIPKKADNITITKISENKSIEKIEKEKPNLITGNFFRNIITGFAVFEEKTDERTLDIKGPLKGALIEYYMPGPKTEEKQISQWKKQIKVSSEEHYENILTYTNISNFPTESINLYRLTEKGRVKTEFVPYDKDENGLIDHIEWITPHLSSETYEVEIVILNVQSYPTVGGNWTVYFNTTGQADLTITGINDTYFDVDLEFIEIKCGDTQLPYEIGENSITVRNYTCENTGSEKSRVITPGRHHLEFNFGGQVAHAHNLATISTCQTLNTANEYYALDSNITDDDGTCFTIGATNITLDCQGYTIDGDADASGYGVIINNANYDNFTLKNCTIQQFARNLYVGVNSDDIRIENSRLLSGYYDGALTYSVENMHIENSSFSGVNEYGMYAWYTSTPVNINWTVLNSNFTGGSTTNDYGFQAGYFYNSTFINNRFIGGGSTGDRGFSLNSEGENITFRNNVVYSDTNIAALFYNTDDSNISNNNITSGTSYGLYLYTNSDDNIIDGNNITSGNGIYVATYSYRNNFTNNQVVSGTNYGVYMTDYAQNNRFVNNNFSATTYSYYGTAYAQNNEFINNSMTSTSAYAIYLNDHCGGNLFLNNLIKTTATGSNRFGIRAIYTSGGNNITGNNITSEDEALRLESDSNNNHIQDNNLTSTAGIAVYLLTTTSLDNTFINNQISGGTSAFYATSAHTNTYLLNNTLQGSNGYGVYMTTGINSTLINNSIISGTSNDISLLLNDVNGGLIDNNIINGTASGLQFAAGTENIDINNNIIWGALGSGNYYGAYLYGASTRNRFINNSINSFHYRGIYLTDANNNTFTNNNITAGSTAGWDNDNGIDIEDAHYNNFTNNFINNTGGPGVRLDTGHNNTFRSNSFENTYTGVYCLYCQMRQTDFANNNISASASGDDYRIQGLSGSRAYMYFLNSTYDEDAIYIRDAFSTVERLWYGTVNVSNTNGQVNNSRILVYDNESTLVANETTYETGLTDPTPLREYIGVRLSNDVLAKTYYNNHTFQATEADHFSGSTTINISSSQMIYINLEDWPLVTILTNYPVAKSYLANSVLQIRTNETRRPDLIDAVNITLIFANGTTMNFPMVNGTDGYADLWEYNYTINASDIGGPFNITALAYNSSGYNYINDTNEGYTISPQIIWFRTYDSQNKSKSFFAENETSRLKATVHNAYENYPKITIKDPNDNTIMNQNIMSSENGTVFTTDYGLNATAGFFDVTISSNENSSENFTYSFYQGSNWNTQYLDNGSDIYVYSKEVNLTEPNVLERYFYPIDININFTESANINSIRVTSYNGSIHTEIPSQVYNYTATNSTTTVANIVWLASFSKGENRTYYIHYNDINNTNASYITDLNTYTTTSNYRFFNNSKYQIRIDSDDGGLMDAMWVKKGTSSDLAGLDPMQNSPSALTITLDSYSAQNEPTPTINLEYSGPVFNKYTISGYLSSSGGVENTELPFNQTYWIYAKTNYFVYEYDLKILNNTYNLENLIDLYISYGDGYFDNVAWGLPDGTVSNSTVTTGNGPDNTNLNVSMRWLGLYNDDDKTAVGEIFLNRSSPTESDPKIYFYDQATSEFYKRYFISTPIAVSAGTNYTSKIARLFWDGEESYAPMNDTYYSLLNNINSTVGDITYGDTSYPYFTQYNHTPTSPKDNESINCYSYWTDDLRLKEGYIETNITGTPVNHTVSLSGSTAWVNYTIPSTDIMVTKAYCKFYAKDIGNNINSTIYWSFNITDVTPPGIENITNQPNSSDDLDPGVLINITADIVDKINLSTVVLLYRYNGSAVWNETNMSLVSGNNYAANFTTNGTGNYSYKINTTDLSGNNNISNATTIVVDYDLSWDITPPTFEATSGLIGSNLNIINVTINNTADYTSNFTLTSTRDTWIYFNGSLEPYIIEVGAKNQSIIEVNGTLPVNVGEYSLTITATHANSTADPITDTTIGNVVAYQSGPYIWNSFTTYSSSVLLGTSDVNYTVKIKNLGNETGTNVTNTITLPTDWTTESDLTKTIGNLTANSYEYHSVLVTVPSGAEDGEQTMVATPGVGNTNQTHEESLSITVVDPVVASSSSSSSGASGGGSGGGSGADSLNVEESERFFRTKQIFELVRGENQEFIIALENPYENDILRNLKIKMIGFNEEYMQFNPKSISELNPGEQENITVKITAPAYFVKGEYELEFEISGDVVKNTTKIVPLLYTNEIILYVFEVSRRDAINYRTESLTYIDEMNTSNFYLEDITELFEELEIAYNETDFKQVKELYEGIYDIYTTSKNANEGIIELDDNLEEAEKKKIEVKDTKRLLHLAKSSFERGEFTESLDRVKEAKLTLALEYGGKYMKEAFYSMKENPGKTSSGFASFAFLVVGTSIFSRFRYLRRRLKKLGEEENLLVELMKEIQIEVFEKAKLSMKEYGDAMMQYEERLTKLLEDRLMTENRKTNLMKFKSKSRKLNEERDKLIKLIQKTQTSYITEGKFETRIYENMLKSYSTRLADIEEQLAMADVKKAFKRR
jgi:parallel beta-helix repeat protein